METIKRKNQMRTWELKIQKLKYKTYWLALTADRWWQKEVSESKDRWLEKTLKKNAQSLKDLWDTVK